MSFERLLNPRTIATFGGANAAEVIRQAEVAGGRVHVTGVGKPEHVAHYAASLLSSTAPAS